ncbi:YqhG family protein [Halobacillus sp. Marseille-P3879]|uniref:YqhG family protein n=1 Tax=Halobacillus sp. Marseille-P3879 TaxID=2045014 RepID=UPI000C7E0593|nr:YqhG family protein [Halobacillus sp. Marseille-P3879]
MNSASHYEFTKTFFELNGCEITEKKRGHMKVKLTKEMDESLMNRPFYWHYMKKMNREGDPLSLTFKDIQLGEEEEGIYLHPGTPKLQQIYQVSLEKGYTTRLYENVNATVQNIALHPWLCMNVRLTFRGKQSKDLLLSLGLNLINGALIHGIMEKLDNLPLMSKVADYTFPMTPLIKIESGYQRILDHIESYLSSLDTHWAEESLSQLHHEKELLESFYHSQDVDEDQYEKELEQLLIRYQPRIQLEVANGGLLYLTNQTSNNMLTKKS